jgi:hypothetical protein
MLGRRKLLTTGLTSLGALTAGHSISGASDSGGVVYGDDAEVYGYSRVQFTIENTHEQTAIIDAITIPPLIGTTATIDGIAQPSVIVGAGDASSSPGYYNGPAELGTVMSLREDGQQAAVVPGDKLLVDFGYFLDTDGFVLNLVSVWLDDPELFDGEFLIEYHLPSDGSERAREASFRARPSHTSGTARGFDGFHMPHTGYQMTTQSDDQYPGGSFMSADDDDGGSGSIVIM